jgi:hypothetical protein
MDCGDDAQAVLLVPILAAPTLVVAATGAERRFGAVVAGCIGAAPVSIAISLLAVGADLGRHAGAALAFGAATHVAALVAFAVVFAEVMRRRGAWRGLLAGTAAFAGASSVVAVIPAPVAIAAGVAALVAGPRVLGRAPAAGGGGPIRHGRVRTALGAAVACLAVGSVVTTARLAGPAAAATLGAYPAMSATFALMVAHDRGRGAAAQALQGLVSGLPGYLAFCLAVAAAAPLVGVALGVPLGLGACLLTYRLIWRTLHNPITIRPPVAGRIGAPVAAATSRRP